MTAFDVAIDTAFADPNQGLDGTYTPTGGSAVGVRVVLRDWTASGEAGGITVRQAGLQAQVRRSEVAAPAKGDALTVDGTAYVVLSARLDMAGVWQLGIRAA